MRCNQRVLDDAVMSVERAGRELEHRPGACDAVLGHQEQSPVGIQRQNNHCSGMDDDVAHIRRAVVSADTIRLEDQISAGMQRPLFRDAFFEFLVGFTEIVEKRVQTRLSGWGSVRRASGGGVGHGSTIRELKAADRLRPGNARRCRRRDQR